MLQKLLAGPLPGLEGQLPMSPPHRNRPYPEFDGIPPVPSAVLLVVYPHQDQYHTVFILRNVYNGPHSGQISFPGGKQEDQDKGLAETALREAMEETGIPSSEVLLCGALTPLLVPVTNFIIHPFVGFLPFRPDFRPDPSEVREIIELPLSQLRDPACRREEAVNVPWGSIQVPCFVADQHKIWGATAMILNEFLNVSRDL